MMAETPFPRWDVREGEAITMTQTNHDVSFRAAFLFWLKLGFISFGGPAGQIATMHTELVDRRKWISEQRFLHALNYCMVLPGPEAQQLATYIGWLMHGTKGGIVAGGLFVLPSFLLLIGLSWFYVEFGQVPAVTALLAGIKPAVLAIVLAAVLRIGSRAIKNSVLFCFALGAFLALAVFHIPFPVIVFSAGLLGWLGSRWWPGPFAVGGHHAGKVNVSPGVAILDDHHDTPFHARPNLTRTILQSACGLAWWGLPLLGLWWWQGWDGTPARMARFFTSAALVTFGGAYAVLPYVAQQAVGHYGWLQGNQMMDGLALGETTPGPLIMIVTFVGFLGGWQGTPMGWQGGVLGACVATYFTFLPSFVFIILGAPWIEQMRGELRLTAPLSAITAAVVGVILNLALFFGKTVLLPDTTSLPTDIAGSMEVISKLNYGGTLLSLLAFIALVRFKVPLPYVVAACALCGLLTLGLVPS